MGQSDEHDEAVPAHARLLRGRTSDRLDPDLVQALEWVAQAAIDATPHIAGYGRDWRPHEVRPYVVKADALLQRQPVDVIANFGPELAIISRQTTTYMANWSPLSTRLAAGLILHMIDEWAGRPRRELSNSRR